MSTRGLGPAILELATSPTPWRNISAATLRICATSTSTGVSAPRRRSGSLRAATCIGLPSAIAMASGTLKHVTFEQARNFCGAIKEYAANLGKANFFLVGEIAGGDFNEQRYLDVVGRNLNAAPDIGGMRLALTSLAKGFVNPNDYFGGFDPGNVDMGSHCAMPSLDIDGSIRPIGQAARRTLSPRPRGYYRPAGFAVSSDGSPAGARCSCDPGASFWRLGAGREATV
jgi:hypothetical protein